jgi:hypothetical protein
MRMMLKILIPTEAGNHAVRTVCCVKSQDASDIPGIVEPLFMGFNAEVELLPAMNAGDLKIGLDAATVASAFCCNPARRRCRHCRPEAMRGVAEKTVADQCCGEFATARFDNRFRMVRGIDQSAH